MNRRIPLLLGAVSIAAALSQNLPASAATFGAPVVVSANNVSEPGIEIAPDGTLYVHGPVGIPLWSTVWRSTNGGTSWASTVPLARYGLGGGDIDLTIQPNGKVSFTDLWLGSATVGYTTNRGDTWVANQVEGVVGQDRQWVANTGRDIVYHVTNQIPAGITVSKSLDGGLTYQTHSIAIASTARGCICPPGFMVAEAGVSTLPGGIDDKVGVIYSTSTGVGFARSVNGGLTWTQSTLDPTGGGSTVEAFPVVANDGNGTLHATWLDVTNSASTVKYAKSTNWGTSWTTPTALVSSGSSVFPWIDARADKVAVSLYHTTTSGKPDNVANSAQWFVKHLESTNDGGTWSALTTADPTAVKSGPICTDGLNCGSDRELGDFQMVALNAAGTAHISYVRSIDGNFDTEVRFVKQTS